MANPGIYDFPPVTAGDTMDRKTFTVMREEDDEPIPLERAAMQVRRADGTLLLDWATDAEPDAPGYGCMELVDGAAGYFAVGPAEVPDEPGTFFYEVELVLADGRRKTWVTGALPIRPQGTR